MAVLPSARGRLVRLPLAATAAVLLALGVGQLVRLPDAEPSLAAMKAMAAAVGAQRICGQTRNAPRWRHVVWIVLENRGADSVLDNAAAPYFNALAAQCGVADNMHGLTHPSLTNYIAMTSGSTHGITRNGDPGDYSLRVPNIFSQLGKRGWRAYNESMPRPCYRSDDGLYAVRHNPASYYLNLGGRCAQRDIPVSGRLDLSARFTMITPNLVHDMHDSSVAVGDAYLSTLVPALLSSPEYRSGTTAIFITFDEAEGSSPDNRIATLMIAPSVGPGTRTSAAFTHYSLLRTTQQLLGLPKLGFAKTARGMRSSFNL